LTCPVNESTFQKGPTAGIHAEPHHHNWAFDPKYALTSKNVIPILRHPNTMSFQINQSFFTKEQRQ